MSIDNIYDTSLFSPQELVQLSERGKEIWHSGVPEVEGRVFSYWSEGRSAWDRFNDNRDRWDITHCRLNEGTATERIILTVNPINKSYIEQRDNGIFQDTRVVVNSEDHTATFEGKTYKRLPMVYARTQLSEPTTSETMHRGIGNKEMTSIRETQQIGSNGYVVGRFEPRQGDVVPTFFAPGINVAAEYAIEGRTFDQLQFDSPTYVLEVKQGEYAVPEHGLLKVFGNISSGNIVSILEIIPQQIRGFNVTLYRNGLPDQWGSSLDQDNYWATSGENANRYYYRKIEGNELSEFLTKKD